MGYKVTDRREYLEPDKKLEEEIDDLLKEYPKEEQEEPPTKEPSVGRKIFKVVATIIIFFALGWVLFAAVPMLGVIFGPIFESMFSQEMWDGILALMKPLAFLGMLFGIPVLLILVLTGLYYLAKALGDML